MVSVVPLFSTQHLKDNKDSCSRIKILEQKKSNANMWDGNPLKLEDIGRCGGDKKPNDHAEPRPLRAEE